MTLVDVRISDPKRYIPGATGDWEVIIGMEVHAQVLSNSKLFSGASTEFGKAPNANVSLVDAAMPGMLPVINEECVRQAVRTGLGLKAAINHRSIFDRKNYFYPDLPQGYQISQYKDPIVGEGKIVISLGPDRQGNFEDIEIGIERLHLEQDAGKSMHDQHPTMSYVDLNRSGVALMEIVSKPDMRSSDEAKAGAHGLLDAFLVDDRQHARHRRIDQRDIGVRRLAEFRRGAGEELRIGEDLCMHLHADDHLPVAGGAGDVAFRIGNADVDKGHGVLFGRPWIVLSR